MPVHVNPFNDTAFKIIFGKEKDKDILIRFLNDLLVGLPFYDPITDITYLNNEHKSDTVRERGVVSDIHCTTQHGRHIIVEMQNRSHANFHDRMVYYNSLAVTGQAKRGKWDFKLNPVYNICFTNFMVYPEIRRLRVDSCQSDTETGKPLSDLQRYIYIQLPMMTASVPEECGSKLEEWIYTLKNMENMKELPFAMRDEAFRRLSEVGSIAALTPEEKLRYDEDQKRYWILTTIEETRYNEGVEAGRAEGIKEGIEEGRKKERKAYICMMLSNGIPMNKIVDMTGMSVDEINRIISK